MRLARHLWSRFGNLELDDVPERARTVAGHCVLDWLGCALAGSREPLSGLLREELGRQSGPCSVVGSELRCPPTVAALLNGAAGHALDFDDTHSLMGGHPTAPVLPAALAQAEERGASGEELLVAFVVGFEVQARIGALVGPVPYTKGWHSTSTIGVFGAAAAACRLLGADLDRFAHALGLAGSQSSGLKANFGTMTKPFHAGHAAERGLLAARLASRGFTANAAVVEARQGYADAAAAGRDELHWHRLEEIGDRFLIEDTLFKFHAACYLTHAAIESSLALRRRLAERGLPLEAIDEATRKVTVTVHPGLLDVCGIPRPASGLEAKFSLTATTAMALLGIDTADPATFVEATLKSSPLRRMIEKVEIATDRGLGHTESRVELAAALEGDVVRLDHRHDTGVPATDLPDQGARLGFKMSALTAPLIGSEASERLRERASCLESLGDVRALLPATRQTAS